MPSPSSMTYAVGRASINHSGWYHSYPFLHSQGVGGDPHHSQGTQHHGRVSPQDRGLPQRFLICSSAIVISFRLGQLPASPLPPSVMHIHSYICMYVQVKKIILSEPHTRDLGIGSGMSVIIIRPAVLVVCAKSYYSVCTIIMCVCAKSYYNVCTVCLGRYRV